MEYNPFKPSIFFTKFDKISYQFLETGTSDRCLVCIVQNLRISGFILYPLLFFLYSPFNTHGYWVTLFVKFTYYTCKNCTVRVPTPKITNIPA